MNSVTAVLLNMARTFTLHRAIFDRNGIVVLTLRGNLSRSAKTTTISASRGEVAKTNFNVVTAFAFNSPACVPKVRHDNDNSK
ncbi:MAG: hypothetical protein QGF00_25150 [Planctomycetota bacterium]|jgi:hypothetical protein|nr:hypothetical protein [Planctomycetota bacterium]MDP7252915.1 hypothetical protein [Planctomycetota bacterium]